MSYNQAKNYSDSLLNAFPNGILTLLPDGKILHINIEAQREFHINASSCKKYQAQNLYIFDLCCLIYQERDILPEILQELQDGKKGIELPIGCCIQEKTMNTLFPAKGQFFIFEVGAGQVEVIFYFYNTTNELSQEYILNTTINRLKIYPWFLNIDQGIFVLDPHYFEYLGITPGPGNTLTLEDYINMVHPDDRQGLTDAFAIQFNGNVVYDKPVPFRLHRGDGTWEWFEGQSTYIGKLSGLPYRLVGICMSIQEHKDTEEILIAARLKAEESDRLKSAFLANMSHEIRTPLNAIVGFSEVISTTYEELTLEEREDYVNLIKKNSAQLLVLISDILDLAKIESNTMEFIFTKNSLNMILKDVYKEQKLKALSQVKLELLLPKEEVYIYTDFTRIKQVVNNLLDNAIKFTNKGSIHFGFNLGTDNTVQLFVEDTGEGIAEEHLAHIFDRFYKLNSFKQGTGLGLSICKTIVEYLKGYISISSKVNCGTSVKVTLPIDLPTSAAS